MKYVPLMALMALGACSTGTQLPISKEPVAITFASKLATRNIDRMDVIEIRSIRNLGSSWSEIGGADCTMRGNGIQANFTTPAFVQVPLYRGKPQSVRIRCRTPIDGESTVSGKTVNAVNLTAKALDEGVRISVGSGGTQVGGTVSIRDRSKDEFDYPRKGTIVFR